MGVLDWIFGTSEEPPPPVLQTFQPVRDATGTYTRPYDYVPPSINMGPGPSFERTGRGYVAPAASLRDATGTYTAPYDVKSVIPRPKSRPSDLGAPAASPAAPGGTPSKGGIGDILGGIFGPDGRDFRARLAMGLEGLTMHPNQAWIDTLQQGIAQRKDDKDKNRTLAWLKTLPNPSAQRAAAALESGAITPAAAVSMAVSGVSADNVKVVGKRLVKVNDDGTVQDVTPGVDPNQPDSSLDSDQLGDLNKLQDDLRTQTAMFQIVKSGYENIQSFYTNPGAVSDYALAVGFAKIVDPGSVAREGEVAAVASAGSQFAALQQYLQNAISGTGKLPSNVRTEIAQLARQIYASRAQEAQAMISKYQELAKRAGLPPDMVWMGGDVKQPGPVPAAPGDGSSGGTVAPPTLQTFIPAQQ